MGALLCVGMVRHCALASRGAGTMCAYWLACLAGWLAGWLAGGSVGKQARSRRKAIQVDARQMAEVDSGVPLATALPHSLTQTYSVPKYLYRKLAVSRKIPLPVSLRLHFEGYGRFQKFPYGHGSQTKKAPFPTP